MNTNASNLISGWDLALNFVVGAFTFVTALSWNDTVQRVMAHYIKKPTDTISASVFYTVLITFISILAIIGIFNLKKDFDKQKKYQIDKE